MENEKIGAIAVDVVGNYAPLEADLQEAVAVATSAGEKIAEGLNAGVAGADALSGAVSAAALGMGSFEEQIQALVNSGSTLAEALATVQSSTEQVVTELEAAGVGAGQAAEQLSLFDEAISVPYADAAGQLNLFADELEPLGPSAEKAAAGASELADATDKAGEAAHHAEGGFSELAEKLVAFGEALAITEGLKEFGAEALHASDNITRASISLTALTDSGQKAEKTIEEIEKLGIQDGLSLPSLLQASTRMTALLGASAPVPELLAKIADGAAVMGKDIGAATDSFDRLATMGSLGARQLLPLGLTLEKVASAMNEVTHRADITGENVSKMFKKMEEGATTADKVKLRVEVLKEALEGLSGIAEETAQRTFGGQWQILANQWEQIMRNVGDALVPVITGLTDLMKVDILPFLKDLTESFNKLPLGVRETVVVIGLLAAAVVPVTLAIGGFGLAISAATSAIAPLGAALVGMGGAMTGAGASYAAMLATGIASAAVWAGLAIAILDVAAAYISMSKAEDLAAKSQADASRSLQEYEVRLRQHGIDISNLKSQYDSGLISTQQYIAGLGKLRDEYLKTHPVIQDHTTATTAAFSATDALKIRMQGLADAVAVTRDNLAKVTEKYNEHKATAQDVAVAYDKWQSATNALHSAQNALLPVMTNVHHALKDFAQVSMEFPDAAKSLADATDAVQIKVGAESMALAEAQRWLDIVMGKYREHNATAADVVKALDLVNTEQSKLNATMGQLPDTSNYLKGVAEQLKDAGKALTDLLPPISKIPPGVRDVTSLLNDMGIKVDDVHNIFQSKLLKDYDELQSKSHTLDEENAAWEKISGSIGKIAKVDLPAALKLYDEHYAQLVKDGAAEGVLLDTESKRLQMIIQIDETTGASATKQVVALELVRLKQQALYDETHLLGDTYVGVINDILKGWDSLGKSIADNIIDEKNWGEVFLNTGKQVAKMILETLVGSAFKALKDSVIESTGLVNGLTGAFNKLLGAAAGGGDSTDLGGWMNTIAGKGAKTASSTAAGSSSAAGLLGTAGAIGGIVSAISGIIGNFQMSDLYGAMKAVALNTLSTANEVTNRRKDAWDQHNGLLDKLDMVFNRLGDVWEAVNKGAQSIVDQLSGMQAGPVGVGSAGGGAASGGGGSQLAPPPNYMGSEVNPSVTPYWMMQNVPTSAAVGGAAHFGASPAAAQYQQAGAAAGGVNLNGPITIAVNGAGSPMETARALADTLRNFSSKFGPYSQ